MYTCTTIVLLLESIRPVKTVADSQRSLNVGVAIDAQMFQNPCRTCRDHADLRQKLALRIGCLGRVKLRKCKANIEITETRGECAFEASAPVCSSTVRFYGG